ncbi:MULTISPECIES: winged helix-turn-helix domain-containing protein [unclassified Haloarcula]|uniref:winged helix-turn-helix domain-containing protein n=1 Tax=unclassified Haloarcula TaxID=2624677 RepID=UPI00073E4C3E|nr:MULTISPECIES: winged helix-turn-helix domain-containing protein [unclassified Haloarcula]
MKEKDIVREYMVGSNKRNRFEEAFERGQRGDISNYEAWLQDQGIRPDRVTEAFVAQYFREQPEYAVNHDDQLEDVAEFLGFFSRREGPYHIPVVGVTGIGKTQFLGTIQHMLDQLDIGLPYREYSAVRFGEDTEEGEPYWDDVLAELADLEKAVILLDDCDGDKRIDHSLQTISSRVEDAFVITAWTPERWRMCKDEITDTLPVSQEVALTPLGEAATVEALQVTMEAFSTESVELPTDLYQRIYRYSFGIPALFHLFLRKTLRETFLQGLELGDGDAVEAAAQTLHLDGVEERVYDLSEKQLLILKHILLARHPQGRRPSELVELLDRDKSTISYHLQNLTDTHILEKEKAGRSTFYRVYAPVKPIVQRRVAQEGEFHA